jgi:ribosomal protein S24E
MNIHIIQERQNPLFGRKEVEGDLEFGGATPSLADLQKKVAEHFKVPADQVAARRIDTAFGSPHAHFEAFVYESKEGLAKSEPKKKEKKAKAGEAAAAEKK